MKLKWKIEVSYKPKTPDAIGHGLLQDIADLGLSGVESVRTAQVYWFFGELDAAAIELICEELLADPVTQKYVYSQVDASDRLPAVADASIIEVRLKPGVTDAVGDSVLKGVKDLGVSGVRSAQTGQKYWIRGTLNRSQLETIAQRLLANEVIQTFQVVEAG
jgi:phosphoribosylformylglycinamidine (FGAM) synthase PurS component